MRGIVSALTELLRIAGVGQQEYVRIQSTPQKVDSVPDTATLLQVLRSDFEDNAYFITGHLSAEIYDPDCYFADPTVKFRGVDTWRRNLQLLVPFLAVRAVMCSVMCLHAHHRIHHHTATIHRVVYTGANAMPRGPPHPPSNLAACDLLALSLVSMY